MFFLATFSDIFFSSAVYIEPLGLPRFPRLSWIEVYSTSAEHDIMIKDTFVFYTYT